MRLPPQRCVQLPASERCPRLTIQGQVSSSAPVTILTRLSRTPQTGESGSPTEPFRRQEAKKMSLVSVEAIFRLMVLRRRIEAEAWKTDAMPEAFDS